MNTTAKKTIAPLAFSRTVRDVVGIEIGAGLEAGAPAVRLRTRGGVPEIVAAGFLPVDSRVPETESEARAAAHWMIMPPFNAPTAALAVSAADSLLRQSPSVEDALSDRERKAYRAKIFGGQESSSISFVGAMPEHVASWAAGLLPEGRKPTASSIQVSGLARINAFLVSEEFSSTDGNALLLMVGADSTALVIFNEFKPLLYREHSIGNENVINAVGRDMNLDRETVEKILNDTLIDPTSMLEPILSPLFRQAELSTDYATRKSGCFIDHFYLCGLSCGARYWAQIFREKTGGEIVPCDPVAGFKRSSSVVLPENFDEISTLFMPAMGAAAAVLEGE